MKHHKDDCLIDPDNWYIKDRDKHEDTFIYSSSYLDAVKKTFNIQIRNIIKRSNKMTQPEPEVVEITTDGEIEEYSKTKAALAELTEQYKDVPDFKTKEGYEKGKKGISEIRGYWTTLEKTRKRLGEDARDYLARINGQAKPIDEELHKIAKPWMDAKKLVDEEIERIKQEAADREQARITRIENTVREIRNLSNCSRTPEAIAVAITTAEDVNTDDGSFAEFALAAGMAKKDALCALYDLRDEAQKLVDDAEKLRIATENQAIEQKKLDDERKAMEKHKADQQAIIGTQMDELNRQKAALKAEQDKIEDKKREEADAARRAAIEKAEKLRKAEQEKEDAARIIADREKFANDEAVLVMIAGLIKETIKAVGQESLSLTTGEARAVALNTISELKTVGDNILNSAVVKSQQGGS